MATLRILICFIAIHVVWNLHACVLPGDLRGPWISSERGLLLFNNTYIKGYSVDLLRDLETIDLQCILKNGTKYLFRADQVARIFSHDIVMYTCLDIRKEGESFYYYVATRKEHFWEDSIYGHSNYTAIQMHEVCNVENYTSDSKHSLRPNVSDSTILNTCKCPSVFKGYYTWEQLNSTRETIWKHRGDMTNCNNSQYLTYYTNKTCNSSDCNAQISLPCLYAHTHGSITYLYTYINPKTHGVNHAEILCLQMNENNNKIHVFENYCNDLMPDTNVLLDISFNYTGKCKELDTSLPPKKVKNNHVQTQKKKVPSSPKEEVPAWSIVILTFLIISLVAIISLAVLFKFRKNLTICFKNVHEPPQRFSDVKKSENNEKYDNNEKRNDDT